MQLKDILSFTYDRTCFGLAQDFDGPCVVKATT